MSPNINNCQFVALSAPGIDVDTDAKNVIIKDCVFRDCDESCIQISPLSENLPTEQLKCNDNIFDNNNGYPISERALDGTSRSKYIDQTDLYEMKDNVLRGFNGIGVCQDVTEANTIYFDFDDDETV